MNAAWIIFKKEIKDITRDRRTIIAMVVVPMLLFPVMMTLATKFTSSQVKKAQAKVLKVGLIARDNAEAFHQTLRNRDDMHLRENIAEADIEPLIRADSLDAAVLIADDFDKNVADLKAGDIQLYFKSSKDMDVTRKRLTDLIDDYENQLINDRFARLYLDRNIVHAVHTQRHDVATQQEKIGRIIGGFVPYLFILFCFMGCMYPAIDLGAGEKERGTLETLLASPANRMQVLIGKFGVIALAGVTSATLAFVGLFVAITRNHEIPSKLLSTVSGLISPSTIVLSLSLLIPLTIFFAAWLMSISVFAKSFKEAQSLMAPMNLVVIFPVFIGILPGVELNAVTALIPVLNVSLATKAIISGTITVPLLIEVYATLIALAALSLLFCVRWFNKETVIFRET